VVVHYFKKIDPKFAPRARELLTKAGANLDEVVARLNKEKQTAEWTRVEHHLRIVVQCNQLASDKSGVNVRDRSMAENIGWLLDHEPPGTRMVVWAHNGHVARDASFDSMGSYLAKKLDKAVVTFGFAFH